MKNWHIRRHILIGHSSSPTDNLHPQCAVVAIGDPDAILDAMPEPPHFLPALSQLAAADRDAMIDGVFLALPTDEDCWDLIAAAAMDTIAHPERGAFAAVAPMIPASLMDAARSLMAGIRNPEARHTAEQRAEERARRH